MNKHLILKIAFYFALLLGAGFALPASAQIPQPPDLEHAIPCKGSGSRYEDWVKDIPCTPVISAVELDLIDVPDRSLPESLTKTDLEPDPIPYTILVFSSYRDGNWEVYGTTDTWPFSLAEVTRMTDHPASDLRPRLRPGSSQVLFSSDRTGNYELFLMDWGGANLQQLTNHPGYDSQPAWSPDGSKIAFASDRDGNMEIYVMNADGSNLSRLTFDGADDFHPSWSLDSAQLVWVRAMDQENGILLRMNADGSNVTNKTGLMRYLQHPYWSDTGENISFDYDANNDGWSDLAMIGADDLILVKLKNASFAYDYWAAAWHRAISGEFLITIIDYIYYEGVYYIEDMCAGAFYWGEFAEHCFSSSFLDAYPDGARIDNTSPDTRVGNFSEYTRAGEIPVSVTGSDPGPAVIYAIYLQQRLGADSIWQNFGDPVYGEQGTVSYLAQPGTQVYFRSRGVDLAENWEAWPAGDGDTYTKFYVWQLTGRIADNRGASIPLASAATDPVFTDQVPPSLTGRFHRFVPTSPVTVTISQPNYGVLPTIVISSGVDLLYPWILPPLDDVLDDGDFESGWEAWSCTSDALLSLTTVLKHTGAASAGLGQPQINTETTNLTNAIGDSNQPSAIQDTAGNTHLVWVDLYDNEPHIFYRYKPIASAWTAPVVINPQHSGNSTLPELALGPDGTLHLVWLNYINPVGAIYYASRDPAGNWSTPADLTGLIYILWTPEFSSPNVAVDSQNTIHVSWGDQEGLKYINKPEAGAWSMAFEIGNEFSAHAMAVGPDDTLHVAYGYLDGTGPHIQYKDRSVGGDWGNPVLVMDGYCTEVEIAADNQGEVKVLVQDYNSVKYSERSVAGQWLAPSVFLASGVVYNIELVTDGDDAYVLWRESNEIKFRRQFGDFWSPTFVLMTGSPAGSPDRGLGLTAQADHIQAFWSVLDTLTWDSDLFYREWDLPQMLASSLTQTVTLPAGLHKPTLSYLYASDQIGASGSFNVAVNDTPVFTSTGATAGWMHHWIDLAPWSGQAITLTFSAQNDLAQGLLTTHIDDITVGSWLTPVIDQVLPGKIDPGTPAVLTILGDNFSATPSVRLGGVALVNVIWIDEHTLQGTLTSSLAPGAYDLWVTNPTGHQAVKTRAILVGEALYLPLGMK